MNTAHKPVIEYGAPTGKSVGSMIWMVDRIASTAKAVLLSES